MSFGVLLPAALFGLAAVLVPVLLHLHRRNQFVTVSFAALRWLVSSQRPRRRPRIEQWLLLLLRMVLLALLALLLAQPVWFGRPQAAHWVVLAPTLTADQLPAELAAEGQERRWLVEGFPDAAQPVHSGSASGVASLSSLLRQLDSELPVSTRLSVVLPDAVAGLDSAAIELSREVDWVIVPNLSSREPSPSAATTSPIRIEARHAPDSAGLRWIQAALAGWRVLRPDRIQARVAINTEPLPPKFDWLLWLDGEPPAATRDWVRRGGHLLSIEPSATTGEAVWRNPEGVALARLERLGQGQWVRLLQPLSPTALPELFEADFPRQLLALLEAPQARSGRAPASAVAPQQIDRIWPQRPSPLDPELGLLIAVTFLVERLLAHRRPSPPVRS